MCDARASCGERPVWSSASLNLVNDCLGETVLHRRDPFNDLVNAQGPMSPRMHQAA